MTVLLTSQLYSRPDACGPAGLFRFLHTTAKIRKVVSNKIDNTGPGIGGAKANGEFWERKRTRSLRDAKVVVLKNTGHWILEENPKETTDALMNFCES